MQKIRLIKKYILHLFLARHTNGFGVHSPFLFQFTQNVLCEKHPFYIFESIELLRDKLIKDKRIISVTDFGTKPNRERKITEIASSSLKSAKYGQLLFRIAHYFKSKDVLELGTSLGITTSYLSSSSSKINCVTLEGCAQTGSIAKENFEKIGLKNIELVIGNIDDTLPKFLEKSDTLDLIFFDANHKSEAVLRYFEMCQSKIHCTTILVVDDIYWSADMENAWQTIKKHPKVTSTIDLFELGIVFFNPHLVKKHYKMLF
jgi:predicted O-methyltransferase YrrM